MTPAVVYPITTPNGYGAVWSLGITGVPVIGLASGDTYFSKSRFLSEFHVVPDVIDDPEGFADALVELGKRQKQKLVIIVTGDIEAFVISTNRQRLEPYYLYPYLDWKQVQQTLHRKPMFDAAVMAGNTLPQTWFPADPEWSDIDLQALPYPVILKPMVSRFHFEDEKIHNAWAFTSKYGKAIEVHSPSELERIRCDLKDENSPVCIQERMNCQIDDLWAHHFYSRNGQLIADFTGRKLHQRPHDFGTGSICRAEMNPEIISETERFVRYIGYSGIGNIEYIQTPDGYKFVEINPRGYFWSSLATSCGVNLYRIQYDDMVGREVGKGDHSQKNNRLIWYQLNSIPDYLAYKDKRIGVFQLLFSPKMESTMNLRDWEVSWITFWRFITRQCIRPLKKGFKTRVKSVLQRLSVPG